MLCCRRERHEIALAPSPDLDAVPRMPRRSAQLMVQAGAVRGFVDLHCHWIAGIDDGAPTPDEGVAMLRALKGAGFDFVMATPHMRPAMFDNGKNDLTRAFEAMAGPLSEPGLPEVGLSSEHYFDDVVFQRMMTGEALPYPGGKAVLVEFPTDAFPARIAERFFDLRVRGLRPVLAHPERYRPVWKDTTILDQLLDGGAVLLLDVAALVGKYGRATERAARELLEEGYYEAACSDAHRAADVDDVARGIERLNELEGSEEVEYLLRDGPLAILKGTVES
jgi:protein-tyrosine phosphatase